MAMLNGELFPLASEQPKSKDLRLVLSKYLRHWYVFAISVFLALGAAFLYLRYYALAEYEITSKLLINDDRDKPILSGVPGLESVAASGTSQDLNNEIEIFESKRLMNRVAHDLSLFVNYYIKGRIRDIEVYGKSSPVNIVITDLDSSAFDKVVILKLKNNNQFSLQEGETNITMHQFGKLIHKPYGNFTVVANPSVISANNNNVIGKEVIVQFRDIRKVADAYSEAIVVAPANKETSVLLLSLIDAIPTRGKDIINTLIKNYDEEALDYKNRQASSTVNFLDERLNFLTSELSGVEKDVEKFKRQNEVADVGSQSTNYIEQASEYNKQLSDWAIQIDVLESIERYLNQNSDQYTMVPSTLGIQDVTLLGLIEKFNGLQLERERMLRTTEASNPLVQNINEQITNLKANILENLHNIKKGLIITSRNLKVSSGQFKNQIRKVPSIERELLEINRQQAIKQTLYSFLLQKREETALELASNVSNSRIIDSATSTDFPVSPKKQLLYLMAGLLGIFVPFCFLYIKDQLNDKIETIQDVEFVTNTPVLGELGIYNNRNPLVVSEGNNSPMAEMFRLIRANLSFAQTKQDSKTVLVTSSMSGEGKTFFSLNLAASLLLANKKVVLLELDLRNSDLSYMLDYKDNLGITDYLTSDEILINDIVKLVDKVPGLHFVSSGPVPVNPSELMMSPKLLYLINELRSNFEYIILDTAPVGKVADVFGLSSVADFSIYMVRCNYTFKRMINIVDDIFRYKKLKNVMLVINGVKTIHSNSYGYGYDKKTSKKKVQVIQ